MKKKKLELKMTRRQVLKAGMIGGAGMVLPLRFLPAKAFAIDPVGACEILGCDRNLYDPEWVPKFVELVPNALDPGFLFHDMNEGGMPAQKPNFSIRVKETIQETGLIHPKSGNKLKTTVWGYGKQTVSWPGQTFQVVSSLPGAGGADETVVRWSNELQGKKHLLPVDTSLHWCYSLPGYTNYSITKNGVPIITHLHGGNTDFQFDGNPEFFYSPDGEVQGPQWGNVEGGFTTTFRYDNAVPAGNLWYHDHALGITRLNVYAGLAGFYFVRDAHDTGLPDNPLQLPAFPYELAYAIQDRMFTDKGELFYPAFPGDPYYEGFIADEDADLPPEIFPGGGPTGLAEFFGDFMVVNGKIWPKTDVEPRKYRMRLLNGCDSRFLAIQFFAVPLGEEGFPPGTRGPIPFTVIGSDQGLASSPTTGVRTLLMETGSRYDIIFDFSIVENYRIIMKNIGGDEPFGGDIPGPQVFDGTDRVMAFDVITPLNESVPDNSPTGISFGPNVPTAIDRQRNVALFEGRDEFNRLQPLLGTAEPATDHNNDPINWPETPVYQQAKLPDGTLSPLSGQMEGSIAWHSPTTENPALGHTELWHVWNTTGDAHPVHLHLVHFKIYARRDIIWDSHTTDEDRVIPNDDHGTPAGDGTYLVRQPTVQHNSVAGDASTYGSGFKIMNPTAGPRMLNPPGPEYVENAPKDMVTALPDQVTLIRANFNKPGRYVWHCHILSHEDHEMMRVLEVG
jgi:spore coat protein A